MRRVNSQCQHLSGLAARGLFRVAHSHDAAILNGATLLPRPSVFARGDGSSGVIDTHVGLPAGEQGSEGALGKRATAYGGAQCPAAQRIELGNEPPLGLDGDVEEPIDRRRVSIRWLAATVLAAVSGAGLMGGAVWAALDGEYRFAQLPEIARLALRQVGERASNIARKADRIDPARGTHERPPDPSRFHDDTQRRSRDRARAPVHSRREQSRRQPFGIRIQGAAVQPGQAHGRGRAAR